MKRFYLIFINSFIAAGLLIIVLLSLYTLYMVTLINQNIISGTRLVSNQRELRLSLNDVLYFPNLALSIEKWKIIYNAFESNYNQFINSPIVKKNITENSLLKARYEIAQLQWNKIHDTNSVNMQQITTLIENGKIDKINGLYFQFLNSKDSETTALVEAFISERSFLQYSFESIFISLIDSLSIQSENMKKNFINFFVIVSIIVALFIILAAVYHITTLSTLNTQLQNQNIKLKDKEEEYRTIFENVKAGIVRFHIDPEVIINCNPAFLSIFNIQSVRDIKNFPLKRFFQDINDKNNFIKHLQETGSCKNQDYVMKKTNDMIITCSITATVEYDDLDRIRWVDALIDDITERKKQEEELELHRYHLEKLVKERTTALNETNKTLTRKQDQIKSELEVAQRLQFSMVPDNTYLKSFQQLDISALYEPLEDVGGDMFDIIQLSENEVGLFIADVSGHGVASALIMTMIKFAVSNTADTGRSASIVCKTINNQMVKLIGDIEHFFTAIYGVINLEHKTLRLSNAGHHHLHIYKSKNKEILSLNKGGMLMGVSVNVEYEEEKVFLESGDGILIYTDGITESRNQMNDFYSEEKIKLLLKTYGDSVSEEFVKILNKDIYEFSNGALALDDKTLVYIKIK